MDVRLFGLGISLFGFVGLVALGILFMRRLIPPNSFVGMRIPETILGMYMPESTNDPDTWYQAHEYAGRLMVWSGPPIALQALALYFIRSIDDDMYLAITVLATCLIMSIFPLKMVAYLRALAAAKQTDAGDNKVDS